MAKRCFVIQGFGKKQDFAQGGKLFNLDASYAVIKEAVEDAGLECYRADELRTNALVDQVMYDQLLAADLVVADITTLNFNAAYELGVRYALRPYATLVVGESGMSFPFDVNHIYIHKYQHLGEDIGNQEARRFRKELKTLAQNAVGSANRDSPVYTFLGFLPAKGFLDAIKEALPKDPGAKEDNSLHGVIERAQSAMRESRFIDAIPNWRAARELAGKDDYVVQQLALATYKSEQPSPESALREAKTILEFLQPRGSFDAETLGLWAAVHKRLFEITKDMDDLEEAVFALERGFFLKQDYYNGINLSFMLDVKAAGSASPAKEELRAVARYIRRKVKEICSRSLNGKQLSGDDKFWLAATLYEACVGLHEEEEALRWKEEADKLASAGWMRKTADGQIAKLLLYLS